MSQVYNDITPVNSLNDAVDDLSFAVNEVGVDSIFFGVFHFLNDDLFGRLGSDAAERGGIHFGAQAIADLAFGIQLAAFLKAYFVTRFGDDFRNLLKLKHLDLTAFIIILNFDIQLVAVFFPGSRSQGFFQSLDQDFAVYSLVSANLFNNAFYI